MPKKTDNPEECKSLCDSCTMCCRYVATEIDEPETQEECDEIRWFLAHKNVEVYIDDDDDWYLQFNTPCEFINENGLCGIYDKRPKICREHSHEECEKYGEGEVYVHMFKTPEDFEEYWKNKKKD